MKLQSSITLIKNLNQFALLNIVVSCSASQRQIAGKSKVPHHGNSGERVFFMDEPHDKVACTERLRNLCMRLRQRAWEDGEPSQLT